MKTCPPITDGQVFMALFLLPPGTTYEFPLLKFVFDLIFH